MTKAKSKKEKGRRRQGSDGLSITYQMLISCSGLPLFIKVFEALKLKQLADTLLGLRGSNRGYRNGDILETLVVMLGEGARGLSDVRYLHNASELLKRTGMKKIPGNNTLSRWLRYHGKAGISIINQLNQVVLATTLARQQVTEVTLDIDATVIATEKASATPTYQGYRGFTLMVGTLAEVGQVIGAELRDGCVSPKTDNVGFIQTCQELLPGDTRVKRARIDAAGYQHPVIDYLMRHAIEFVIRAAMNPSIAEDIAALPEQAWQPLRLPDGSLSTVKQVARCQHRMYRSKHVFELVAQRTRRDKPRPSPSQKKVLGQFIDDTQWYDYRAIAINIKGLDDSDIVNYLE